MAARAMATLFVTVDVEFPDVTWGIEFNRLELAAHELLDRLNGAGVPATWGLTDVAHPLGDDIVDNTSHELALHAGPSLVGSHLPRATFVGEMSRRMSAARLAGHVPTTLQLAPGCRVGHLDALGRFGITALRGAPRRGGSPSLWRQLGMIGRAQQNLQPQMIRWGVYQFPTELVLPETTLGAARRAVDQAISAGRSVQVAITVRDFEHGRRPAAGLVDGFLRHVNRRRHEDALQTLTLDQHVARIARGNVGRPSHSILRTAA